MMDATLKHIVTVMAALYETVKEAGSEGAPSGPMYMAANQSGISLDQYQRMMDLLTERGLVRKAGHVYFYVETPTCE
jgi:hypothetical protein